MKLDITDEMLDRAKSLQKEIAKTGLFTSHPNYTKIEEPDRYAMGYLGEFVAVQAFENLGLQVKHLQIPNGQSQGARVYANGHSVNVKTATNPTYRFCMFPKTLKIPAEFVCAVRLNIPRKEATIEGFASLDEVLEWPIKDFGGRNVPARYKPFSQLHDLDWFKEQVTQ